jgi:AhpD family alkylhydroperoxidase
MEARMKNPALMFPDALEALRALHEVSHRDDLPDVTRKLVQLRASQINGCSVCVHMHSRELEQAGQSRDRIFAVSAWRDTPFYTDAERAALDLAECLTRLADRPDPVPDTVWKEARKHYDEPALGALILDIAGINVWNRLNAAVKMVAGGAW